MIRYNNLSKYAVLAITFTCVLNRTYAIDDQQQEAHVNFESKKIVVSKVPKVAPEKVASDFGKQVFKTVKIDKKNLNSEQKEQLLVVNNKIDDNKYQLTKHNDNIEMISHDTDIDVENSKNKHENIRYAILCPSTITTQQLAELDRHKKVTVGRIILERPLSDVWQTSQYGPYKQFIEKNAAMVENDGELKLSDSIISRSQTSQVTCNYNYAMRNPHSSDNVKGSITLTYDSHSL